jgi:hypothetical protein
MPDSLPLTPAARARKRAVALRPSKISAVASANSSVSEASCHTAPPRDVARLLAHHDTSLPRYLDIQHLSVIQEAHQRWPLIRTRTARALPVQEVQVPSCA